MRVLLALPCWVEPCCAVLTLSEGASVAQGSGDTLFFPTSGCTPIMGYVGIPESGFRQVGLDRAGLPVLGYRTPDTGIGLPASGFRYWASGMAIPALGFWWLDTGILIPVSRGRNRDSGIEILESRFRNLISAIGAN